MRLFFEHRRARRNFGFPDNHTVIFDQVLEFVEM